MYTIGLTGGIASGKSSVVSILKERGLTVIEADRISRELLRSGGEALREVREAFPGVFTESGVLNREALSHLIHRDDEARERLNQITHPRILKELQDSMEKKRRKGLSLLFVDVPLLFEVGIEDWFLEVWLIYVEREVQIHRLMVRDRLSKSEALERISSQIPLEEKVSSSHRIIYNTGDRDMLYKRVHACLHDFLKEKGLDERL